MPTARSRPSVDNPAEVDASTSRGWKRKRAGERIRDVHKVTETFVKSIGEDRMARREEHNELLTFNNRRHLDLLSAQLKATRSARQT